MGTIVFKKINKYALLMQKDEVRKGICSFHQYIALFHQPKSRRVQ